MKKGAAAIAISLTLVASAFLACSGGTSGGSSSGGGFSSSGSSRGPTKTPPPPMEPGGFPGQPPPPPSGGGGLQPDPPTEMPFVACKPPSFEGEDAGAEANAGDAAAALAETCETPPPDECLSTYYVVQYSPGVCDVDHCVYSSTVISCKGGCYTKLDGRDHCNR